MSNDEKYLLVLIAIAVGAVFTLIARLRPRRIRGLSSWKRTLVKNHGSERAHHRIAKVRQRYNSLLSERPLPDNPVLRQHVTGHILPGLALYQVLLEEYQGDQQTALAEVDQAFRNWTLAEYRLLLAPLKYMPVPFSVFRMAFGDRMIAFPPEGWDIKYVENSNNRIAFNVTRCFYLKTLTTYGATELTPSFCKTDEVMAELLPSSIQFVRNHTIGQGDEVCDFQYWHVRHS